MANALAEPTTLIHNAHAVRVALRTDAGYWDFEGATLDNSRLRVETVSGGLNDDFPRAELTVDASGVYSGGVTTRAPLTAAQIAAYLDPDAELLIYVGDTEASRRFLFHGQGLIDRMRVSDQVDEFSVICTSKLEWIGRQKRAWITGRYLHDRALEDPASPDYDPAVVWVPAMPCVFNKDGKPNRAPKLHAVKVDGDYLMNNGALFMMPVFAGDNDADAVYWSLADVLVYLLAIYVRDLELAPATIDADQGISLADELLADDNVCTATPAPSSSLKIVDVLRSACDPLSAEGLNAVDALLLWCKASGCCMQQATLNENDEPATHLLFHLSGDGGPWFPTWALLGDERTVRTNPDTQGPDPRSIRLPLEGAPIDGLTEAQIMAAREMVKAEIVREGSDRVTSCRLWGMPELYELTVGKGVTGRDVMLPGWEPDTMFGDDLYGSAASAKIADIDDTNDKADSGDPQTMFNRYTTGGSQFSGYRNVGRLWVLNEDLRLEGAMYGRVVPAAFDGNVYDQAVDWHGIADVPMSLDAAGARTVRWAARRRRILPCVTLAPGNRKIPAQVQCSFDSGSNWIPYPGNYQLADDSFSIWLSDGNLAAVKEKTSGDEDADGPSVWEAIVLGTFRLAVTCGVEGDSLAVVDADAGEGLDTLEHHFERRLHKDFEYATSEAGNSELAVVTGNIAKTVDESVRARSLANRIVALQQERAITATVMIPYLTDRWRPGDLVENISPRGIAFSTSTARRAAGQVCKVEWISGDNNQITRVVIGDRRLDARRMQ